MNSRMIPTTSMATPTPIMEEASPQPTVAKPSALDDDEPLLRHLADGPRRAFLRVSRCLHTAVGHLVAAEGRRLVHHDAAEFEGVRGAERGVDRGGEDRRLEAELRGVRALDALVH